MHSDLLRELSKYVPTSVTSKRTYLNALIYGDWGVGKTSLACSSGRNTLLISSGDGGESVLRNNNSDTKNVSIVQCAGLSHVKAIFSAIIEQHQDYKHYEVVVVDTVSSICDQYLHNLVANYNVNKDRHTAKPKTTGTILEAEGMGDYKFLAAHMRDLAPISSIAPVDVVWLSHEREPSFTDEANGKFLTRPKMPEKASDALAEVCDVVGLLEKKRVGKETKRTLNFDGSDRLAAKSRIDLLEGQKSVPVDEFWKIVETWRK